MNLATLILTAICVLLVSAAVNIVVLWLCCWLWRVKGYSLRRVLSLAMILIAIQFALYPFVFGAGGPSVILDETAIAHALLAVGLATIIASCLVIKWTLHVGMGRAAGILLTSMTLNSIFAYALALPLRAAVVEAFVVPTGAMAPTILGQHVDVECPNCGKPFCVGLSASTLDRVDLRNERVRCLNCGFDDIRVNSKNLQSGDRILVDKTNRDPKRWQLVVFHPPLEKLQFAPPIQGKPNYVMRLVGLPGEELEIFEGDVFINGKRLRKPPGEAEDLWLPVHDSQFVPGKQRDGEIVWQAEPPANFSVLPLGGWKCETTDQSPLLSVKYIGATDDQYDYNLVDDLDANPIVRDWRITTVLESIPEDGAIGFQWSDGVRTVSCTISPGGNVALRDQSFDPETPFEFNAQTSTPLKPGTPLSFSVRDGLAYLMIDNSLIKAIDVAPEDLQTAKAEQRGEATRLSLRLFCYKCETVFSRIELHRDVHYRTRHEMDTHLFRKDQDRWKLANDGYFFLGDNSQASQDARFFGPTKHDAIVGVVKCCYCPRDRIREFP